MSVSKKNNSTSYDLRDKAKTIDTSRDPILWGGVATATTKENWPKW